MCIRIVIADDHEPLRQSLRSLLKPEADIEVVAEAETGCQAIERVSALDPDVVLMDVRMPSMNGIEATVQIRERFPKVKVIALSMHADRSFVNSMLDAGATGYVLKKSAFEELAQAIRSVMIQQTFMGKGLGGIVEGDGDVGSVNGSPSPTN